MTAKPWRLFTRYAIPHIVYILLINKIFAIFNYKRIFSIKITFGTPFIVREGMRKLTLRNIIACEHLKNEKVKDKTFYEHDEPVL